MGDGSYRIDLWNWHVYSSRHSYSYGAFGLEVMNSFIPIFGTTTVQLTFTATKKESVKRVVNQIKEDCIELYSYELRDRRTSQGEIFEASIEMKVKRGNHNERLINYMDEFDDVTISSIE